MDWRYIVASALLGIMAFAASLALITVLLVNLSPTFFLDSHSRNLWIDRHPVIRWSGLILKNLAGWFLVLLGGVLLLPGVPGQGVLTILFGLVLVDFPGKRKVERRLLSFPRIRLRINRLRARFGKPPLLLEESSERADVGRA
jgi:hypothetical protein